MTAMILLSDWQKSQIEFWRKTQYDGYDVSSFGRVRSSWSKGVKKQLCAAPHLLSGSRDSYGYLFIEFGRENGKRRRCWVHRLVAVAFLPNPLPEINHKTGIKNDNRLDNLEWITKPDNIHHSVEIGLRDNLPKGENHSHAMLTEIEVREIRQRVAAGETMPQVAHDYPVTTSGVKHIIARRSWKHVD